MQKTRRGWGWGRTLAPSHKSTCPLPHAASLKKLAARFWKIWSVRCWEGYSVHFVSMKVIKAFPPNYGQIRAAFPYIRGQSIIFAFGDRIYYPGPGKLSAALIEHESVHGARQGSDPAGWWARYIADPKFRLDEEIPAHRAEYRVLCQTGASFKDLDAVARRLCSPLYEAGISLARARDLVAG